MTDPRLAALAAALHATHHHITIANGQPSPDFDGEFASAILGERRVFLPEGLGLMCSNAEGLIAVGKQLVCARAEIVRLRAAADGIPLLLADITERDAKIARLRGALDALVQAGDEVMADDHPKRWAALRAALAKAKEAAG